MGWADDLKKLTTKGGQDIGRLAKAVKIEAFSGIVSDTRVDTGRLRGNWQIQEDAPASGEIDRSSSLPNGVVPPDQNSEIVKESSEDGVTYFVNNLPYAVVYEEKDAMVARNVERVKANIKQMAEDIK